MNNKMILRWFRYCLRLSFLSLLITGIFLRIWGIDKKPLWCDESLTLIRTSGYAESEVLPQIIYPRNITNFGEINQYLSINPNQPLKNTWKALSIHPEHPPLYYLIIHFWRRIVGDSITVTRLFSVLIGLLILPCAYWLSIELFQSSRVAYFCVILISISPLHIYYSQEAREYILWGLTTLLATTTLLRAQRINDKFSWLFYAISLIAHLYTHLFGLLIIVGHGIYIILCEGLVLTKKAINWIIISICAFTLFLPWPLIFTKTYRIISMTGGAQSNLVFFDRIKYWVHNYLVIFIDGKYIPKILESQNRIGISLGFSVILIFLIICLINLVITTPQRTSLLLISLLISALIPLVIVDLYLSWKMSSSLRYLMPFWISIEILIAYFISQIFPYKIAFFSSKKIKKRIIELLLVCIFCIPLTLSIHNSWRFQKLGSLYSLNHENFISIFDKTENALVINTSSSTFCTMLSLSHYIDSDIQLILISTFPSDEIIKIKKIPPRIKDIFLFDSLDIASKFFIESEDLNKREIITQFKRKKLWKLNFIQP